MKHRPKISYSQADIERYLSGNMSRQEMRQLELASLDDAFLADAIEGYMQADVLKTNRDLTVIEKHIFQEKEERKVIPLWSNPVFKIAAVIIIMAGFAWLSFEFFNKKDEQLAQTKTVEKRKEASKAITDTPVTNQETVPPLSEKVIAKSKPKIVEDLQAKEKQQLALQEAAINEASKRSDNNTNQAQKTFNYSIRENKAVQSKVENDINDYKPVARAKTKETATINDSFKEATALIAPAARPPAKIDTPASALEGKSLNEVVVTGYGTRKRKDIGYSRIINISIDTIGIATPVIGWEKLKTEIRNSLKAETLDSVTNITISFIVNKNKSLRKIKTNATTNKDVSDLIIGLIETKEYWLPSSERIRLVIRIY